MIPRLLKLCLLMVAGFLFLARTDFSLAQETEEPVVHAVLFFSPTCPHCHEAITNVMIPLMEEYQEQLAVVGIDVSLEVGNSLYRNAVAHYEVPENRQGVPTLIIEDTVLVSTLEIENEFPGMIEAGLANGGNDWPEFPGMADILIELTPTVTPEVTMTAISTPSSEATITTAAVQETAVSPPTPLAATATAVPVAAVNDDNSALSLADVDPDAITTEEAAPPPDPVGFALGWLVVLGLLVVLVFSMWKLGGNWSGLKQTKVGLKLSTLRSVLMWLFIVVGLIVSGYLAYVETMQVTAVCGPVGECNIVQGSSYARLFGVPIAVWGILFYLTSAVLWLLQRVENVRHLAALGLVGLTIFGSLFSLYLTLLELLVIGAICAWCLTSAVVTGLMLLLSVTSMEKRPLPPDPQWQAEVS
jgi:uncharacterized membrane protein/thiol-disulfide isomerase/thioredoxin